MFEDFEDDALEFDEDASDREILHVIWLRSEAGDLPTDEGWALLAARYPDDPRFLLVQLAEEIAAGRYVSAFYCEALLLSKLARLVAASDRRIRRPLVALLAFARATLGGDVGAATHREIERMRADLGTSGDEDEARTVLSRSSRKLLREAEAKTRRDRPIRGAVRTPVARLVR